MEFKAIVSGHIYIDDDGDKDIEILSQIDNDHKGTEIFCDIEHALIDNIEIGDSDDYYFIAIIESNFVKQEYWDCTEYDVEHYVKEIKTIEDI